MGYYNKYGRARVNPESPRAFAVCDRCGIWTNLHKLQWQMQWNATQLYNQQILVCSDCYDTPQTQLRAIIIPTDPPPLSNIRTEFFKADESNPTQPLRTQIVAAQSSITTFFIDLYDGNPTAGGTSVLGALTGTPTRTDFASSMTTVGKKAANTSVIQITDNAKASVNVGYIAIFNAATAGTLLMSAPLLSPQTIVMFNGAAFPIRFLQVALA